MRILVVEDNIIVGLDLAEILTAMGDVVLGPCPTVAAALGLIDTTPLDFAILDFNLQSETSEAIADTLASRSIPFIFLTGYRRMGLPAKFADIPILAKPFAETSLADELARYRLPG